MGDITHLTDAELHDRLQAIHDEIQQMMPRRAKTDERVGALFEASDADQWRSARARLEAEKERIRCELRLSCGEGVTPHA